MGFDGLVQSPRRLMLISGQEGVGKSSVMRALLPRLARGAVVDGEDVGQVHPWVYDEQFRALHRRNVAAVVSNFWTAGYPNVVTGSILETLEEYRAFRVLLTDEADIVVVELVAAKAERDRRRQTRSKTTTKEWRDMVDRQHPDDSLRGAGDAEDVRHVQIDTTDLDLAATVLHVTAAAPDMFTG
jgi:hypothetical protein